MLPLIGCRDAGLGLHLNRKKVTRSSPGHRGSGTKGNSSGSSLGCGLSPRPSASSPTSWPERMAALGRCLAKAAPEKLVITRRPVRLIMVLMTDARRTVRSTIVYYTIL
jgi:hypothetical protein